MNLSELLASGVLLFDGAMGTMLQQAGLPVGSLPEIFNLTRPDIVTGVHRAYVQAGADIVTANTFGANSHKLAGSGHTPEEIIAAGVRLAKESGARFTALDIGPSGQMLAPLGTLSFEDAYALFAEQIKIGAAAGADLIIIETMSDLYEMKAALLAAKESCNLPVVATMTFQEDGRTFTGCEPAGAALTLSALGADAVGVNCSLGPKELLPIIDVMLRYSRVPVIVQANAGLPVFVDGETVFPVTAGEYAHFARELALRGVGIIGGCCGTTPDFIRAVKEAVAGIVPVRPSPEPISAAVSGSRTVLLDERVTVIGERINPTGKKKLQRALREGNFDYVLGEAMDQAHAGADLLDVNVGVPDLDEPALMRAAVLGVQSVTDTPLVIDSAHAAAVEAGCRLVNGRPVINSVNGKPHSMAEIFPLVKKYGALVVGLTLDEAGIPETAEGRLEIARRIVEEAGRYGIPAQDILIDCLTLTASAQQEQVMETLRAIRLVKRELSVKTVLGVSNVSFGLPRRELLNAAFLAAAFGAGLDAAILNPLSAKYREIVDCYRVLNNEDRDAAVFIARYGGEAPADVSKAPTERDLREIILQGRREEAAPKVRELLETLPPLEIVNNWFVPALNTVGERFERGEIFLPQLMQSADTVKNGFEVIRAQASGSDTPQQSRGRILIATVEGDIHDIGKNIVRMMLENYGYEVIDLGRDVPAETVADTIAEKNIRLAGLSALMTTTVQNMKKTVELCRARGLDCRFVVGGAVLNEEYTAYVGADYYARDAMQSVEIANRFFGHS